MERTTRNESPQRESPTTLDRSPSRSECAQNMPELRVSKRPARQSVEAATVVSNKVREPASTSSALTYRPIMLRAEPVTTLLKETAKQGVRMQRSSSSSSPSPRKIVDEVDGQTNLCSASTPTVPKTKSFARAVEEKGDWKKEQYSEDWIQVQRKRLKNRFVAVAGIAEINSSEKFRAADINIPLFINNVNKSTSEKDILDYIMKKAQLEVTLHRINSRTPKQYNAYKVFVPKTKLSTFLNDSFWPEGVSYRRYIDFKKTIINNG